MTNPEGFLSDTGAEMWENRVTYFEPILKDLFGGNFNTKDFDDVVLIRIPSGWEYKILLSRNGNEECITWDPEDPGRTIKFAEKVEMDTL